MKSVSIKTNLFNWGTSTYMPKTPLLRHCALRVAIACNSVDTRCDGRLTTFIAYRHSRHKIDLFCRQVNRGKRSTDLQALKINVMIWGGHKTEGASVRAVVTVDMLNFQCNVSGRKQNLSPGRFLQILCFDICRRGRCSGEQQISCGVSINSDRKILFCAVGVTRLWNYWPANKQMDGKVCLISKSASYSWHEHKD